MAEDSRVAIASRRALGPQRSEPFETGLLERALGFLRTPAQREFVARDFPIMTVDNCGEMAPAIRTAIDVSQVHRPPLVTLLRATAELCYPNRTRLAAISRNLILSAVCGSRRHR